MAETEIKAPGPLAARVQALIARIQKWKPFRVWTHYGSRRGPILAAGLAYQALFSVFAALWAVFSAAGLVIASNPQLQDALFTVIGTSVPGLIDRDGPGGADGAINPDDLFQ